MAKGDPIGEVTHFFGKINVAVLRITQSLSLGVQVRFKGANTDFIQEISSMQIDHVPVEKADPGADIAVKVDERVRRGDFVYFLDD